MGLLAGLDGLVPAYAAELAGLRRSASAAAVEQAINLQVRLASLQIDNQAASAVTVNGTIPGPLVRLQEGQTTTMQVSNQLAEDTSIHWHGLILPAAMDGVPGVSYAGIKPGETFTYQFPVEQNGTYWYHSHSGLQEQLGHFGPIIIDPIDPEPFAYDREYVVMLSDWTFEDPYKILVKLKRMSDYYNFQNRTVADFFDDVSEKGWSATVNDRLAWARMRMSPTDFADITGYTYTYLINGMAPVSNWTGLFRPGEKIRLRFINAATMSYFDIRIPGLKMTVVQADGQNIQPVPIDEFRIAVAETYDVIVEPEDDRAYSIFAESMDRSGFARGTLAPREGMTAPLPKRRPRPLRTMKDMGMAGMDGMSNGEDMDGGHKMPGMMDMPMQPGTAMPAANRAPTQHGPDHHGIGSAMVAEQSFDRLSEPGAGLKNTGTRVLVYSDLRSLTRREDNRPADREIELHLTGVMDRYMWSFDGKKYSEVDGPIPFHYGERLRLTLVNDTMMDHPIHLHGMWMELENGAEEFRPRKHTLSLKPAERLSALITVDAPGDWAFHCHLLYHMDMGMFRVVRVSQNMAEADQ